MNKKLMLLLIALLSVWADAQAQSIKYRLAWKDDFKGSSVDWSKWEKIPRGPGGSEKYMTASDSCYVLSKGILKLRTLHNTFLPSDTVKYLTGGIRSRCGFMMGKIEVRARLGEGRGFWPAIWMLPVTNKTDTGSWRRDRSEMDIMEHLNYDDYAYQTVHNNYTVYMNMDTIPPHYNTGTIRHGKFNVYAVEVTPDSLVYSINGKHTLTYPKLPEQDKNLQFEYHKYPFFLIINCQLGGSWVGPINPNDVPVDMDIDWVKYYVRKE